MHKTCSFYLLFIYAARVYSQLAGHVIMGKGLVISVSQRQSVNGSANSQQNVSFYFVVVVTFIMIATRNSPGYPS